MVKPLAIALSGGRGVCREEMVGAIYPMYNVRLFRIVTINCPQTTNIS
jgi:hypothetical protein